MAYTRLGHSGAIVSRIALGTMNFWPVIGRDESFGILDLGVENGITVVDTADVYGGGHWGPNESQTEELLGEWLRERGNRDSLVLATKAKGPMGMGPNDRGLSAHIAQYREHAELRRQLPLVTEQSVYNLSQRTVELEVLPAVEHYGMGPLPLEEPGPPRREPSEVRGARSLRGTHRRASSRARAGLAAAPAGGDGSGGRAADLGATHQCDRRAGSRRGCGAARRAGPDLARPS